MVIVKMIEVFVWGRRVLEFVPVMTSRKPSRAAIAGKQKFSAASSFKNDATSTKNGKMADDFHEAGDVFRIPDLWAPSSCLKLGLEFSTHLFADLKLDGQLCYYASIIFRT